MAELTTLQPARHPKPTVKARKLAYLLFERPDLEKAERFLNDFDLHTVSRSSQEHYLLGAGTESFCYRVVRGEKARFVGLGFEVGARQDLDRLPEASPIQLADYPGGERVRLADPSGFTVEAIHG